MKKFLSFTLMSLLSLSIFADYNRNIAKYNLNEVGQGLIDREGNIPFDPVASFPEGGALSVKGDTLISHGHEGVEYLFSSDENRQIFLTNPKKYEPTYGGYCAFAMASGRTVQIKAKHFIIRGNRIHYFVNSRAKGNFSRNADVLERNADTNWERISGELPRF